MNRKTIEFTFPLKRIYSLLFILVLYISPRLKAQSKDAENTELKQDNVPLKKPRVLYGTASFYADQFEGRETANGDIYRHNVPSAACNVLPLGTWIRVTNLKNDRSVIVRVNDRLHPRMRRIVDLNKASAIKLGYVKKGLEEVKVEVLGVKKPNTPIAE